MAVSSFLHTHLCVVLADRQPHLLTCTCAAASLPPPMCLALLLFPSCHASPGVPAPAFLSYALCLSPSGRSGGGVGPSLLCFLQAFPGGEGEEAWHGWAGGGRGRAGNVPGGNILFIVSSLPTPNLSWSGGCRKVPPYHLFYLPSPWCLGAGRG